MLNRLQKLPIFPPRYKHENDAAVFSRVNVYLQPDNSNLIVTANWNGMARVRIEVMADEFLQLVEEYKKLIDSDVKGYWIYKVTESFIYNAAKFTPPRPSIGHISIQKNLYNRHVEKLSDVINSNQATDQDRRAVEKGMKFKVFKRAEGTIGTSRAAYGYAKTASEANQMKFIVNRGLARWSWGSDAPILCRPKSLDTMYAKRAPHLRKYHFNQVLIDTKNGNSTVVNYSKEAIKYLGFARQKGLEAANVKAIKICKGFVTNINADISKVIKSIRRKIIQNVFGG